MKLTYLLSELLDPELAGYPDKIEAKNPLEDEVMKKFLKQDSDEQQDEVKSSTNDVTDTFEFFYFLLKYNISAECTRNCDQEISYCFFGKFSLMIKLPNVGYFKSGHHIFGIPS